MSFWSKCLVTFTLILNDTWNGSYSFPPKWKRFDFCVRQKTVWKQLELFRSHYESSFNWTKLLKSNNVYWAKFICTPNNIMFNISFRLIKLIIHTQNYLPDPHLVFLWFFTRNRELLFLCFPTGARETVGLHAMWDTHDAIYHRWFFTTKRRLKFSDRTPLTLIVPYDIFVFR